MDHHWVSDGSGRRHRITVIMESRRNGPQLSSRHDDDDDCAYTRRDGQAELTLVAGYIPRCFTRPQTVTHPSTNRARRWLTSLMRPTTLPTEPNRHVFNIKCRYVLFYWVFFVCFLYNTQEGDGDFSQISSDENDFQLDDELPSNIVSIRPTLIERLLLN